LGPVEKARLPLMKITDAVFVKSAEKLRQFPQARFPEIAFSGRSNVGKSSMINCLVQRKGLARTSSTPGRTRMLNFYLVNRVISLVDLPGYGYAKVPGPMRRDWKRMVEEYLEDRRQLRLLVLIIDLRRGLEGEELDLLDWLGSRKIPAVLAATKADKLSQNERARAEQAVAGQMSGELKLILFSSTTCQGREELWNYISAFL